MDQPTTTECPQGSRLCFKLNHPCDDCPFSPNNPGFLGRTRALEIAASLGKRGESFLCHKTLDYMQPADQRVSTQSQHCYGAMLTLHAMGEHNQVMQLADRFHALQPALYLWTTDQLDLQLPHFATLDDFVAHHTFSCEADESVTAP